MAQPKVIKHQLEDLVLAGRREGRSNQQIADACNADLQRRGVGDTVTKKAVERYLATLDKATVPAAHEPTVAAANATIAIDFGERLQRLDTLLRKWLDEAENAVTPMRGVLWDPYAQEPMDRDSARESAEHLAEQLKDVFETVGVETRHELADWIRPVQVMVPDWQARTSVSREMREHLKAYADLMQRIHDARQVQAFQESVVEAISEASPEVAHAVVAKLRERQSIQRAALLGAA